MKKHGNEFVNSKKLNLMPIIALLIIAGLIWYIYDLKTDYKIEKSANEYNQIKDTIDSIETKKIEIIDKVSKNSQSSADRADKLTKSFKNEKIIIRDTTYDAMCEYLTNYRP